MRRRADDRDEPSDAHIAYVGRFLGGLPVTRLAFFDGLHTLRRNGDTLDISMRYAGLSNQKTAIAKCATSGADLLSCI
jgi:hypothetical protein